ncbi:hypothetical protein PQX77_020721 [Marasmius sp. AFHP31]|nr:hypothetical protein PQX77_020721 [Marasmius sp. AFHP31]
MPSYVVELYKRDSPLTPDKALWIGAEKAMLIGKAREIVRNSLETRQMSGWGSGVALAVWGPEVGRNEEEGKPPQKEEE